MRTLILVSSVLMAASPAALADSGTPNTLASGESAAASVETTAALASVGFLVAAGSAVAITGSTAGVLAGDERIVDDAIEFGVWVASIPFDGAPLEVTDAIIVADEAPAVPFETPDAP